ncbi:MAG: MBL fold metallo-hydrolase [Verrucomicrobia bacterium]|nr:MBL fold metallo-hydrolase [Verrucomicrobiota bacterium]NBU07771.1 MBL fold metallo-hydrolase [Pseudomonadota bacterium]NDA67164.1 MBL fold metallo-hydrolase [Verrucomicrobiota bacterium]NDB76151.1 MBL fold metallo-hydrolase [Verrucomicrobiota bacterium]NDD39187.1 MBL fold metallo-hydrolase [Verrucomicrobiota bacterium]
MKTPATYPSSRTVLAGLLLALAFPLAAAPRFTQPDAKRHPNLFTWTDTCNVHVIRDGDTALLIDLGDGSVLDHLSEIGVKKVEWVLFTHHQREQCQGAPKLKGRGVKLAAPEFERALFENPANFRKMIVRLGDPFTVHGSSFVRPAVEPIKLDQTFAKMDTFTWRGREFRCVDTRGNSPGGMSYFLNEGGRWLAFTGDVMMDGAKMHTWFDTDWDYGFAAGVWAIANASGQIAAYNPAWMLPSHGQPIANAKQQIGEFQQKLYNLERLLVRGYPVMSFAPAAQDVTSQPTDVPNVWQVSKHVFKFRGPSFAPNFYMILADSGRALVVDCGLIQTNILEAALDGMRQKHGLKAIDAMVLTHMHGDHFLQAPHLKKTWGTQFWALDRMKDVCERPEAFDYAAPIQAYGNGVERIKFDRLFKSGETFDWEGFHFTIDWMPGQTEFGLCLNGMIDGRKVAFTGDNIFGNPADPKQNGHEAMSSRTSGILDEGYIVGAEYLSKLKPDILLGGHSFVMDQPAKFIERYRKWSYEMRDAFRGLSSEAEYRWWFDPFWVRAEPHRLSLKRGETIEVKVNVRNFEAKPLEFIIAPHAPPGLQTGPQPWKALVAPQTVAHFVMKVSAEAAATPGIRHVAFDITRGGKRQGELFDCIVEILP